MHIPLINPLSQSIITSHIINYAFSHILHEATGSRGYTDKTRLRGFQTLNFVLVRVGGLRLYSRDF